MVTNPTLGRILRAAMRIILATFLGMILLLLCFGWVVRQPNRGRTPFPEGSRADAATLQAHVELLSTEMAGRNPRHPEILNRAADHIHARLSATSARVEEQTYTAGGITCRNVIAHFGPPSGDLVVVGAHYDVWGDLPGADDNASAVAGLLELARLLSDRTCPLPVQLVAYSTEEPPFFGSPLMGSAVHATRLAAQKVPVRLMICLEMIGYYRRGQTPPGVLRLLYPGSADFVVLAGRWQERHLVRRLKRYFRGASDVAVYSYSGPSQVGTDLSDHRCYWQQGYPAVMVTDTAFLRNPNYHQAGDTADTLDYRRMAGVVDGVLSCVLQAHTLPSLP